MKKYRYASAAFVCFLAGVFLNLRVFAEEAVQEFAEEDRRIFGIFPVWGFLLLLAGIVMAAIIIIVEIFKRKMK